MADVAKLAGVGTMTVSRLLSGSVTVSEATAKRIQRAIEKLHYQPNELARALRGLKTRTIGVILPYLYDPFFAYCAHAIATVAKEHGYSVILTTSTEDPEIEDREASEMLRRHVEGMVIFPARQKRSYLERAEFQRAHIVMLDRPSPLARFDSVTAENKQGARLAIDHLIEHGHRRILCAGLTKDLHTFKVRYAGYRESMAQAKLKSEPYLDCSDPHSLARALRSILNKAQPPTAVFSANNLTMRYILLALNELGVSIPDELAIVGFDDFELAEILNPTLTVVRQPCDEMGRVAAEMLFARIQEDAFSEIGEQRVLPVELVVRRSCGCSPAKTHEAVAVTSSVAAAAMRVVELL